jgi:hypothetical protein
MRQRLNFMDQNLALFPCVPNAKKQRTEHYHVLRHLTTHQRIIMVQLGQIQKQIKEHI